MRSFVTNMHSWAKTYRFILIVFVLALILRLIFLAGFGLEDKLYDSVYDQFIYLDIAKSLMQNKGFALTFPIFTASPGPTSLSPPMYPFFLAGVFTIFGSNLLIVRLLHVLLSALTCVLIYAIGKQTLSEATARVAAVITCCYLPFIMFTRAILTETVFIFLLALAVFWTLRLLQTLTTKDAIITGILWAITILTRPESLFYMAAMGLYTLAVLWHAQRHRVKTLLLRLLPGAVVFVVIFGFWIVRNYNLHNAFVPVTTQLGINIWEANYLRHYREVDPHRYDNVELPEFADIPNYRELNELEKDRAFTALATSFIRENPTRYAYFALTRVLTSYPLIPRSQEFLTVERTDGLTIDALDDFPNYSVFPEQIRVWSFRILFVCAVVGALFALRQRKYRVFVLIALVLVNIAGAALIRGKERARLLSDPYLILMSAEFLVSLFFYIRSKRRSAVTTN